MGGWKLEASKMFFYLAFPVSIFCLFSNPTFVAFALRSNLQGYQDDKIKENVRILERRKKTKQISDLSDAISELEK